MAALVLHQTRSSLLSSFRISLAPAALFPASLAPTRWSLPSLDSLLELFPPFLLAVPKKKVSHSRKAMRSANKGLKDKHNIVNCPGCGSPKLAHHLCSNCYNSLTRNWKAQKRLSQNSDIPDLS